MKAKKTQIYTLGYEGLSLDKYIDVLQSNNVSIVLDVREKAWSYKPGFSKTAFEAGLKKVGIRYVHVQSAGNPSSNRKTAPSVEECLRRYKIYLESHPQCLEDLIQLIESAEHNNKTVCLTCFEKDYVQCHRSILIDRLTRMESRLQPVHLK